VKMDKSDYRAFYRGDSWGGKAQPDSMYGLCFRYCLSFVLQQMRVDYPSGGFKLHFVIEGGHPNEGAPATIVSQLIRKRIKGVSEFLGNVTIGEKTKCPGLQAATALRAARGA
jgi:hypothetical protein